MHYRLILSALLIAGLAHGQSNTRFLQVTKWQGTYNYKISMKGSQAGTSYTVDGEITGTFVVEQDPARPLRWTGNIISETGSFKLQSSSQDGCAVTDSFTGAPPLKNTTKEKDVLVNFYPEVWTMHLYRSNIPGAYSRNWCGAPLDMNVNQPLPVDTPEKAYPASGLAINESFTAISGNVSSVMANASVSLQILTWQGNVKLQPDGLEEYTLDVESGAYDSWRPTATPAAPWDGDPIDLSATLRLKSGGTPKATVDRFVWELVDTSSEPGISINFPSRASDRDLDMVFQPLEGQTPADDRLQKVTADSPPGLSNSARVVPRDWGGWSTLRVTAYVHNGPTVVGEYKGSGAKDVRLPKRASGSFTAEAWKKANGVTASDQSDEDSTPNGDGAAGDGLTLYEEYRGYYENGKHKEGNPKVKDYFLRNETGATGEGGAILFAIITDLAVHYRLAPAEFDTASRVINANYSASPHVVDQHGVWMKYAAFDGYAQAVSDGSGPSTPKHIQFVGLPAAGIRARKTAGATIDYASVTVAHELLHTVNVYHHGDNDQEVTWSISGGNLIETSDSGAMPIRVFKESGQDDTPGWIAYMGNRNLTEMPQYVGQSAGQHSGVENCVMRYDIAGAYPGKADSKIRYIPKPGEIPGVRLCSSSSGDGVNAPQHAPQPRYFNARAGRGGCKNQILVNDRITAPRR